MSENALISFQPSQHSVFSLHSESLFPLQPPSLDSFQLNPARLPPINQSSSAFWSYRSPTKTAGGVMLVVLGVLATIAGAGLIAEAKNSRDEAVVKNNDTAFRESDSRLTTGAVIATVGGVSLVTGAFVIIF